MRPLFSLAVIGAMALLPLTASAQRGSGGHGSSGSSRGSSGFSGGHAGGGGSRGFSSPRGISSPRFGGGFSSRPTGSFAPSHHTFVSRPVGRFNRAGGFDHFRHFDRFDRFPRPFIFTGGCIHGPFFGGFPCRRFFFGGSFVLGYAPLYADYSYYPDSYSDYPPPPSGGDYNNNNNDYNNNDSDMSNEVNRLSGEVDQLRNDEQNRSRYEQSPVRPSISAAEPAVAATLVFRDGRKLSISNYAIVGQTVWILSNNSARKIPIADLDVAATQRVNEANGIDFHLR
jgi:hypothetical protein